MTDINCSHCGEPWDVWGLKNDSIGYLDDDQADQLAALGTADDALDHIARVVGSDRAHELRTALATIPDSALGENTRSGGAVTLPTLMRWWWNDADLDSEEAKAAKDVVETAIYAGVARGAGCPSCGFDHGDQPGQHRETTMRQLVDGADDTDPTSHLL